MNNIDQPENRPPGSDDAGLASLAGSGSILERTARGAGWVIGWRMTTRLLGIISTLILVRLLTPADFGVVALAMSLAQGLDQLSAVGIEDAIIRADRPDRALYDTGFTINVIRGVITAGLLAACAVPIARFFKDPQLVAIMIAVAIGSAVSAFENIGIVDFRRYIAFDKEFILKVLPRIISIFVGISLAFIWHSYWALIAAILTAQFLTIGLGYWMHPFRPRFTLVAWRQLAGYSSWTWAINIIGRIRSSSDNLVIGRFFGPALVGIYGVGAEVAGLPNTELVSPLCRAAFSGFAEARQSGDDGADTFLRLLGLMALLTVPAGLGLSLVAYPVIRLGFGSAWLGAVPLIQVLGVAGILTIFGSVSSTLFYANAWLKAMTIMNIATTICRVLLLIILVPRFGLMGAAIAVAITDIADQLLYLFMTLRKLRIGFRRIFTMVIRTLIAACAMAVILRLLNLGWTDMPGSAQQIGLRLAETVLLGGLVYVTVLTALWVMAGKPIGAETDALKFIKRMTQWSAPHAR